MVLRVRPSAHVHGGGVDLSADIKNERNAITLALLLSS
jgi:hypothetical protein